MKDALALTLTAVLALALPGCIVVRVSGDMQGEIFQDEDLEVLTEEMEASLVDPSYRVRISASPWHKEATWSASFVEAGSDREAALASARRAVLHRIEREGGRVVREHVHGPHEWGCDFVLDGRDPGQARVRWVEHEDDSGRDMRIEISWEETD